VRKVLQLNLIVHKTKQNLMTQNQIKKEERQELQCGNSA